MPLILVTYLQLCLPFCVLYLILSLSPPSPSAPQFSLFGSRSASRTTANPPSSSSSSSSLIQSTQTVKRTGRPPCSSGLSKAEFLERVRRSNEACQQGEYALAVRLYSEALTADPQNCILYSNRSAAYLRLGQYSTALDDAIKARLINPKWPKVRNQTPGDWMDGWYSMWLIFAVCLQIISLMLYLCIYGAKERQLITNAFDQYITLFGNRFFLWFVRGSS